MLSMDPLFDEVTIPYQSSTSHMRERLQGYQQQEYMKSGHNLSFLWVALERHYPQVDVLNQKVNY